MAFTTLSQFTLTPLSAGDIIDRAVRLYRQHFMAFLRIVLPPSLLAYAGGVLLALGWRSLWMGDGTRRAAFYGIAWLLGALLWVIGKVGFLMVMGAAARALVWHFFDGSPIAAQEVYRSVRERLWSLLGATLLLTVLVLGAVGIGYIVFALVIGIYVMLAALVLSGLPYFVQVIMHVLAGILIITALLAVALGAYARVIYLPQVMMVEGKGVFDSFGRSFQLAGREIKRVGLISLFQLYLAWSVYLLLLLPLLWYAYWNDVSLNPFAGGSGSSDLLWINVMQQALTQIGEILLAPIILISFTLLYVDARVRKEGFDLELLANRILPKAATVMGRVAEKAATGPLRSVDWSVSKPPGNLPRTAPPVGLFAPSAPSNLIATAGSAATTTTASALSPRDTGELIALNLAAPTLAPARLSDAASLNESVISEVVTLPAPSAGVTMNPLRASATETGEVIRFQDDASPLPTASSTGSGNSDNVTPGGAARFCPHCGARREFSARFCEFCGEAL